MKILATALLLTLPCLAQAPIDNPMQAACGDGATSYSVSAENSLKSIPLHEPGKAMVVLVTRSYIVHYGCGETVRLGMDGKWLGALCLDQHLVTQIEPGDHHLCVDLQNRKGNPAYTALTGLHAEAGKTYYIQAYYGVEHSIFLQSIDRDEGSLLLQTTKAAVSAPKR